MILKSENGKEYQWDKKLFLWKKIDEPVAGLTKTKREKAQITHIRDIITTVSTAIKRIRKEHCEWLMLINST